MCVRVCVRECVRVCERVCVCRGEGSGPLVPRLSDNCHRWGLREL